MVEDSKLNGAVVAEIVRAFLWDREGLRAMANRAKALANPDAAARLADLVEQWVHLHRSLARSNSGQQFTVNSSRCGHV